jgi:ribonucleoside-diphosphate reductase beta chain
MSSLPIKQYPLTTPSTGYKPFKYQWAFDFWLKQQQLHWLPEEVSFAEDVKDWKYKLNDGERSFLSYIFRFFTQGDIDVNDNYMDRYTQVFKNTEVKMMLAAFSNMETVHVHAYSLLLETVNMPSSEYTAFLDYEEMRNKHEFLGTFNVDDPLETLTTLAIFGGFVIENSFVIGFIGERSNIFGVVFVFVGNHFSDDSIGRIVFCTQNNFI